MACRWGAGLDAAPTEWVFDLRQEAPALWRILREHVPHIEATLEQLQLGLPVMSSAAPGLQGDVYRLRWHNRSVCLALGPDARMAPVVVIKGSEPFLPDFEAYLDWMTHRQFGTWPRPIAEHFPLAEGKAPGCMFLHEALGEARKALAVQQAHLQHYGGFLRLPVPLAVFRLPLEREHALGRQLSSRLSEAAFSRIAPHLDQGVGGLIYYYPGPPVRVHAAGRPQSVLPGQDAAIRPDEVARVMVPGWTRLAARLLWLGFLPSTPVSWRLGDIFEPNNACLDGGACDVGSIMPIADAPGDAFVLRSVVLGVGSLRTVVARALGLPLGEMAASLDQDILAFYLGDYVKRAVETALDQESCATLALDPRIRLVFGGPQPLGELLTLFQGLQAYLATSDYVPPA